MNNIYTFVLLIYKKFFMKRAIFPGTFDRLQLFDEIIIAIGVNQTKKTMFDLEKRKHIIEDAFSSEKRVKVRTYNTLTVDFAEQTKANFILRGVRTVSDFEYEQTIANANRQLKGIETVILFTDPKYSFISSTVVRELLIYNKDISQFLPPNS